MRTGILIRSAIAAGLACASAVSAQDFKLTEGGYFRNAGVDVMAFDDFYPEGHQGGISIIMNGHRVAANGDLRFEATPGQWQPVPKLLGRTVDGRTVTATLAYPDEERHLTGFNPMVYPDARITYSVTARAVGNGIEISLDLDEPIPDAFAGKAGFNLEFFPGSLFGKPWIMDGRTGIYPTQPNSPLEFHEPNYKHTGDFVLPGVPTVDFDRYIAEGKGYNPIVADDMIAAPYAVGRRFTSRPDDPYSKITIETLGPELKLYDGRMNHNNGWFVLRSEIPAGATKGAVRWIITPNIVKDWIYTPVIQVSQVGYHPAQDKVAVVELDSRDRVDGRARLIRIAADGERTVLSATPAPWGGFLRYKYARFDFSSVREPGLYRIVYGNSSSHVFRIDEDVFDRGVWQPVIEYFLPNQMCHMRVSEKYRVWHDACHLDDARMALDGNGIDGYVQRRGLSPFKPGGRVEGVAVGGWHDAGDFDLRIESQSGESYILSMAYELFRPEIDVTLIDHERHVTEIHEPDGKNDILQQIENGALSVVAAYNALGRPYRGIISHNLRQYVLLGDPAAMTDGIPGNEDDRWIYTEDNPGRDLATAANLAGTWRSLRELNRPLAERCLEIARELFRRHDGAAVNPLFKLRAAAELYLSTGEPKYKRFLLDNRALIFGSINQTGWYMARIAAEWERSGRLDEREFALSFRDALHSLRYNLDGMISQNPYGVPYNPSIWGAGWDVQRFGYEHYFLVKAYPDIFGPGPVFDALNFILGCHPGSNTASFASGVGAVSATTAYGSNRADWSYIPGGVVSGTAVIRPDFPELLEFPYLWQQTEYVLGGGSSHYMFLVLATRSLLGRK